MRKFQRKLSEPHCFCDQKEQRHYNTVVSVGPPSEKFNIVSNDHGHTQKCNFCVSNGKTNFTDHDTPDTLSGLRDSVLVYKMHDCYCTIRKKFGHFHLFLLIRPSHQAMQVASDCNCQLDQKTNHFQILLNVFTYTTYTYSNCIVYPLFCC